MALDRQSIERKDFAIRRRGYDPGEVDAHLAAIAAQIEERRPATRSSRDTLAVAASEHVRAVVEAAEKNHPGAAGGAGPEPSAPRATARPQDAPRGETAAVIARIEVMQKELAALVESLRTGGDVVSAGLQSLEDNLEGVRDAVQRPPAAPGRAVAFGDAMHEPLVEEDSSRKVHGDALAGDSDDARLVALNMALNGRSREETERYLAENFKLRDEHALVDEVYASVEG